MHEMMERSIDNRKAKRVELEQPIRCRKVCSTAGEIKFLEYALDFNTIDISAGGVGILSDHEVDKGMVFCFPLELDGISYNVNAKVIYCIKQDIKYRVGFEFVETNQYFDKHRGMYINKSSCPIMIH